MSSNQNSQNIAFSCFGLEKNNSLQLDFFGQNIKKSNLNKAIDSLNKKFGTNNIITDAIGFGKI